MSATEQPSRPVGFDEFHRRLRTMVSKESVSRGLAFRPGPDDIVISPFGKCGTTWTQQIVQSLRSRGDLAFDDISRVIPWIEPAHDLGLDLDAPQCATPRAFKSHLPWDLVPKGARYLVSIRDPRDALVSMYRFMEGWFFEPGSVSIDEFARRDYMGRESGRDYWSHLLSWWQQRERDSVLLLSFENMKQKPEVAVRLIADFIGVVLDDELLQITLEQSSIEAMIARKNKYDDLLMRGLSEIASNLPPGSDSAKVREGKVGAHRYELSDVILQEMDAMWQRRITPQTGFADYASLAAQLGPR